ncbi:hypothetical protein GBAR_LOCUS25125 [Geodia barretti]|uniref:Uncharacterized protein n=1 Tax=Geodia barretti TaxID=519541 RepID=A0AA35TD70_GEOBA|nr:hypothetical protein GBAR_LOCUS25125 [Geodia barretti]
MASSPLGPRAPASLTSSAQEARSIDVRTPGGLSVPELVKTSDCFMTNFRRNILDRWGIDIPAVADSDLT